MAMVEFAVLRVQTVLDFLGKSPGGYTNEIRSWAPNYRTMARETVFIG